MFRIRQAGRAERHGKSSSVVQPYSSAWGTAYDFCRNGDEVSLSVDRRRLTSRPGRVPKTGTTITRCYPPSPSPDAHVKILNIGLLPMASFGDIECLLRMVAWYRKSDRGRAFSRQRSEKWAWVARQFQQRTEPYYLEQKGSPHMKGMD